MAGESTFDSLLSSLEGVTTFLGISENEATDPSGIAGAGDAVEEAGKSATNSTTEASANAVTAAGTAATEGSTRVIFDSWLGGSERHRTFEYTIESASDPTADATETVTGVGFDRVLALFLTANSSWGLRLLGASNWNLIELESLDWRIWIKGWPVSICLCSDAAAIAIEAIYSQKSKLDGIRYRKESDDDLLSYAHTALDAISMATAFSISPHAQAVGAIADAANAVLYLGSGKPIQASMQCIAIIPYVPNLGKPIYNSAGDITGYVLKRDAVRELGTTGVMRAIREAILKLRVPTTISEIFFHYQLRALDGFVFENQDLIIAALKHYDTKTAEAMIDGICDAAVFMRTEGIVVGDLLFLNQIKTHLRMMAELGADASHVPGIDEICQMMTSQDWLHVKGALFEFAWAHAHRTELVEAGAKVVSLIDGQVKQGVDMVLDTRVVELKAFAPEFISSSTENAATAAEKVIAQLRSRLDEGIGTGDTRYLDVEVVFSSGLLGSGTLPEPFKSELEQGIATLVNDYAAHGAKVRYSVW